MLTTIREKSQGAFAWIILIVICVPFALWGINNYLDKGQESPVASVGSKDFYQRDVNKAYDQYSQNFKGLGIDEVTLKQQALQKLIKDEVLLQYVQGQGLAASDQSLREFIKSLPYFQTDGKFDETKYKSILAQQRLSSVEFANRIRNALIMEQFQQSISGSAFATTYDVENFYRIQNQKRDIEYAILPMPSPEVPKDEEISAYYQQHQDQFQSPEQVSIDYVELKLADIAAKVDVNDEKLKAYYEEQKDQYTNPERRKISHILFSVNDKITEQSALQKAQQAQQQLKTTDFAELAKQASDDKLTAKNGGDLGLFTQGVMEKPFEEAVAKLGLGQISDPVKTTYGYHLIKVTELTPTTTKPYDSVKDEVAKAYQKAQAENSFYETGEKLAELSYQNPDSLIPVADALGLPVKKSSLFTKEKGEGIATNQKIREAAFSEDVLQGNNSSPIELGSDGLAVIRLLEHKQAALKDLASVKNDISALLTREKAKTQLDAQVKTIKQRLNQGEKFDALAAEFKFTVKTAQDVLRRTSDLALPLREAIFKAPKPVGDQIAVASAVLPDGQQAVVRIVKVTEGEMSETDKKQMDIAKENIANLYGQDEFAALLASLEKSADITIHQPPIKPEQVQE